MKTKLASVFFASLFSIFAGAQSNFVGSGISLSCDGSTSNYVSLGDVYNDLDFPFTFEAWLNVSEIPQVNKYAIFTSDNDLSNYNGFWITINTSGQLIVEFGDGDGELFGSRVGEMTGSTIPIKQWVHVAVICKSAFDINIYFNGLRQPLIRTDGAASISYITHSSAGAAIGFQQNMYGSMAFNGQLDEIRLWNISKDSAAIINKMCQKLTGTETGLIGYWTADESYTSNTVIDHTTPEENGLIVGMVGKITSGAPIGDVSAHVFTENWKGVRVSVGSTSSDRFTVKNITNNAQGVFVYRVDSNPYSAVGLNQYPSYYYGVFVVDSAKVAQYNVVYHFNFDNGVVNSGNQLNATLFDRTDGSVSSWTNANAALDTGTKKLTLQKVKGRNEYILNVNNPGPGRLLHNEAMSAAAYPNPFSNELQLQITGNASSVSIMNASGVIVYHSSPSSSAIEINTSSWADGLYLVAVNDGNKIFYRKIILNR